MIDTMFQEGTDRALDDQVVRPVLRPQAPKFSLGATGAAGFKGIGAGALEVGAFASEVAGAFGQTAERISYSLLPASNENQKAYKEAGRAKAIDWNTTEGEVMRTAARDLMPDANTAHASEQVVAGLTGFATKGITYTLFTGPLGGAALLGGDAGLTEADRLKAQGVDLDTRTKAGAVAGTIAGASMLVPMTGPSALYRFGVGSTAGAAGVIGQAAAEREILRAAGYDHLADTFDPFELKALGVGSLVPGLLGAVFGKARPVIPKRAPLKPSEGGAAWDEANAASRAQELSPDRLGVLRQELANPATPAAERARLQAQIDAIEAQGAIRGEPDAAPAVRVAQAARAIEDSRPPALDTLAGRDAHVSAVELAADQIGRGEPVAVTPVDAIIPAEAVQAAQRVEALIAEREQLLPVAANLAERGEIRAARQELAAMEQERPDLTDAGVRAIAKEIQAQEGVSYKAALSEAKKQTEQRMADFEARQQRLQQRIDSNAEAQRAVQRLGQIDNELPQAQRAAAPARLAQSVQTLADARQPKEPARRAAPTPEAPNREAPPPAGGTGEPPAAAAGAGTAGDVQAARVASAADEVARLDPEMLVQLDGMDAPVKVGELLAAVKEEAARDLEIGKLVEVAAQCALRT